MTFCNDSEVYLTKEAALHKNCWPFHPDVSESLSEDIQNNHKASDVGWQMNVITGAQIYQNVHGVFKSMEDYFYYDWGQK